MITTAALHTILVLNQDSAKDFYVDKLGFEVRQDDRIGEFRWLVVGPRGQPDTGFVLMEPGPPQHDAATGAALRDLIAKGTFGIGVLHADDCRATYADLRDRGVEFVSEPAERPYGVEALFRDDSGNWFSLGEPLEPGAELDLSKPWDDCVTEAAG